MFSFFRESKWSGQVVAGAELYPRISTGLHCRVLDRRSQSSATISKSTASATVSNYIRAKSVVKVECVCLC